MKYAIGFAVFCLFLQFGGAQVLADLVVPTDSINAHHQQIQSAGQR